MDNKENEKKQVDGDGKHIHFSPETIIRDIDRTSEISDNKSNMANISSTTKVSQFGLKFSEFSLEIESQPHNTHRHKRESGLDEHEHEEHYFTPFTYRHNSKKEKVENEDNNESEEIETLFLDKVINMGLRKKTITNIGQSVSETGENSMFASSSSLRQTFRNLQNKEQPTENIDRFDTLVDKEQPNERNLNRRASLFNFEENHDEKDTKGLFDHKKFSDFYSKMIEANMKWKKTCLENDENYFMNLAKPQQPKCLVISCSDSRVVVNDCLGLKPGELFSHRNIGNIVISTDFNVQSVIQYAVQVLKVEHLIVVGHTDCGAVKAALTSKHHGLIDHWLRNIRETAEKYSEEIELIKESYLNTHSDKSHLNNELVRKLIELNVKESVLSLCKTPIVQKAWKKGQTLFVHGYVLEIDSGNLFELDIKQKEWEDIEDTYKFDFDD